MRERFSSSGFVLPCYLLLACLYLFYWPHAEFVIDDWFLFQNFEQARAKGLPAEWQMVRVLFASQLWATFRMHWLSLVSVFGLYHIAGLRPGFYFVVGILLHALVSYLLYRILIKLEIDGRTAFLAGALFVLLPTAHNPLFWFPSCGQYILAAFWFLLYFRSVAQTVATGKLTARAAALQALMAVLTLFSTDQSIGLLLGAAPWLALCWRSRAGLTSSLLTWAVVGAAGGLYVWFFNEAPVGSSVAMRFDFSVARMTEHLRGIRSDYRALLGVGGGYYHLPAIGWLALAGLVAGLLVFWRLNQDLPPKGGPLTRVFLLGVGLWAVGYGPVWFLQWPALRYEYLPTLGLAVMLAGACAALSRPRPRLFPAGAALMVAYAAATTLAEIQQCWKPQSRHLQSIKGQLRRLNDLRSHDVVVISATPMEIGTAPHFVMVAPYSSTPFAELVTGVWGVVVGREIFCESGKWGLQHTTHLRELKLEDLRRTHVLVTEGDLNCTPRTVIACEVRPGAYEFYPAKGYTGWPPIAPRTYSHDELKQLEKHVYLAHRHGPTPPSHGPHPEMDGRE